MQTHGEIDRRSLLLAREIAERIDGDPQRRGVEHARSVCRRWLLENRIAALHEWSELLNRPWEEVRAVLLDETEYGKRMRQSSPFCGILSPHERWGIYKKAAVHATPSP